MHDTPNARAGTVPPPEAGGDALPSGTRLADFEIRQVIGAGGFGIVYRAWDEALQRDVALKEYMPVSLAGRSAGERVTLRSQANEQNFALGLQSFVNEARLLARFDHPALVKVLRFWEANGTAYMAMPLYKGRTLRQLRKEIAPGALDDGWAHALIEPLLGALEVMHDAEVYHRDIAPDNILWCDNNRPVLLDFGAARLVLADRTQNVTAILKPQFAPIEQYAETPAMRQGPWTDLYALAGTCFFMLTGRAPLPATARVLADEQEPLARIAPPGCSPRLLRVLDWALAVRPQDRPQSVGQFRDALAGRIPVPPRGTGAARATPTAAPAGAPGGAGAAAYEKTIQLGEHTSATHGHATATSGPATRVPHDEELERPERSVLLPPRSRSPLAALLLLLALAGAAAGGWATRAQWLPLVGLQAAAPAVAPAASAAEASASASAVAAEAASASASVAVAEAASAASTPVQAPPPADEAAASAPAAPASEAAVAAPVSAPAPVPVAEAPAPRAVHAKPATTHARPAPAPARPSNFVLPPPVLPPADEAHVGAAAPAAPRAPADHSEPTAVAATATPAIQRNLGPREACADQAPAQVAACIKRLCDSEPRYQRFPICQRVHRKEEQQGGAE